jgi:hypothetical protein
VQADPGVISLLGRVRSSLVVQHPTRFFAHRMAVLGWSSPRARLSMMTWHDDLSEQTNLKRSDASPVPTVWGVAKIND